MMKRTILSLLAMMASVVCFAAEPLLASDFVHIGYMDENMQYIENPTDKDKEVCAKIPGFSVDAATMKRKGFTLVAGRWLREDAGGVIKVTDVEVIKSEDEEDCGMTTRSMSITFPTKAMRNAFVASLKKMGFDADCFVLYGAYETDVYATIEGNTVILSSY